MPGLSTGPLGLAQPWGGVCIPHEGSGPESLKQAFLEGGKQAVGGPNICLGCYLPCTQRVSYHSRLKLEKLLFYVLGQLREDFLWIVNSGMQILDNYYVPDCARSRVTMAKKDKFGKRWGKCPGSQWTCLLVLWGEEVSNITSKITSCFNFSWASPVAQW